MNAIKGQGHFEATDNKKRISYKFKINKSIKVGEIITMDIAGEIKGTNKNKIPLSGKITLNKITNKIAIDTNLLKANGMDVTFIKRC